MTFEQKTAKRVRTRVIKTNFANESHYKNCRTTIDETLQLDFVPEIVYSI